MKSEKRKVKSEKPKTGAKPVKSAKPTKSGGRGSSETRRIAANMLAAITRGKTLDEVRDRLARLPDSERNLADAIVQTTLRHFGEIDAITRRHMKRPLPVRPHIAHALLFIGAAQLLYMNVPSHAAIHETVAATGRREQPFRGLINAVLRQIDKSAAPVAAPVKNLPDWMRQRFEAAYGAEKLAMIAAAHTTPPPLDIGFKKPEKAAAWALSHGVEQLTQTHVRLTRPGEVTALDGFDEGDWFVQDVAASLPADMLLAALNEPCDILDLCAAPGGKTLQLAAAGHRVTALDISANRLKRLADNLARMRLSATLVEADALDWQPTTPFAAIMLDAPCSASGTLRRHPDLALHRRESHIAKLTDLQSRLLARAADWLAPQGLLCYAVCSLDPAEGEERAAAFLAQHETFCAVPPHAIPDELVHRMALRTTPADWVEKGGMDGFFAQLLQKQVNKSPPWRR